MPRQFIPKQSGPHRIACAALYKALLLQCSGLELPTEVFRGPINPIKHLIRKQFRRNQHDTSPFLAVAALKVGYETEELLHAANQGDGAALQRVLSILKEIQSESDSDRSRMRENPDTPKLRPRRPEPFPGAAPVLESRPRPLTELTGRRQIPTLVSANGIPFLRFKKPQSPFLSRVLDDKIKQKQKQMDHVARLRQDIDWAKEEDKWDGHVRGNVLDEKPWQQDMKYSKRQLETRLHKAESRTKEISSQMLNIIDEETRLFQEERKARKIAKSQARSEARLSRPESGSSYIGVEPHRPPSQDSE